MHWFVNNINVLYPHQSNKKYIYKVQCSVTVISNADFPRHYTQFQLGHCNLPHNYFVLKMRVFYKRNMNFIVIPEV